MLPFHNTNYNSLMHTPIQTMEVFALLFLLFTTTAAAASPNTIPLLNPHSGSGSHKHSDLNCLSWRLAVETNNLQNWTQVPACKDYVRHYMLGKQYRRDVDLVADEAYEYAKGLTIAGDGKDVWVFDIDETSLSNLPYYSRDTVAFGAIAYNFTAFNAWVEEAAAPAIPGCLKLYKRLVKLGLKIVFLTERDGIYREGCVANLKGVGYTTWEKLIMRGSGDIGSNYALVYKSKKREELEAGGSGYYRIRGNIGDQWSDLLGSNYGYRTFKVPNPMYYVG